MMPRARWAGHLLKSWSPTMDRGASKTASRRELTLREQVAEPLFQADKSHPAKPHSGVITGEQDAGKLACPVREGADGKGPGDRDLAGGLLHLMRGGWKRGTAASGQ